MTDRLARKRPASVIALDRPLEYCRKNSLRTIEYKASCPGSMSTSTKWRFAFGSPNSLFVVRTYRLPSTRRGDFPNEISLPYPCPGQRKSNWDSISFAACGIGVPVNISLRTGYAAVRRKKAPRFERQPAFIRCDSSKTRWVLRLAKCVVKTSSCRMAKS